MTDNPAPQAWEHPFTLRRSHHYWAHQMMTCSAREPESLRRMRFPTGEGGPGPYRVDYCDLLDPAILARARAHLEPRR